MSTFTAAAFLLIGYFILLLQFGAFNVKHVNIYNNFKTGYRNILHPV